MKRDIEVRIVSHDVGGRGFNVELKYPPEFERDVLHVLFEADTECAEEMVRTNRRPEIFVAPFCLGASEGTGILNIMANPYFSSLLEPDEHFQQAACEVVLSGMVDGVPVEGARYDAIYANENRVVRKIPVSIRALDDLIDRRELPLESEPDVLSVDTQGTEFDVLHGARRAIRSSVLAFASEVEFRPMYKGQKLFSRIFDFAVEQGFEFAGFTYLQDVMPAALPIGQRARDSLAFGDALFMRRLDLLRAQSRSEQHFHVGALKLAFIDICFQRLADAIVVLRQAFEIKPSDELQLQLSQRRYAGFLERLHRAASQAPQSLLYTDRHTLTGEIKSILEAHGATGAVQPESRSRPVARLPNDDVENVLIEHGFHAVAAMARRRRHEAQPYIPGAVEVPGPPRLRGRVRRLLQRIYHRLMR